MLVTCEPLIAAHRRASLLRCGSLPARIFSSSAAVILEQQLRSSGFEASEFQSMSQIQSAFPKAKILNADRVRFELTGGCRLIVALKFKNQIAFIKFVGTHAEYDRVDALTVSQF